MPRLTRTRTAIDHRARTRIAGVLVAGGAIAAASCSTDLGTLGGEYSVPHGISAAGIVVGDSRPSGPPGVIQPGQGFVYDPTTSTMTRLTATGASGVQARAVVDWPAGTIITPTTAPALIGGVGTYPDGHSEALIWATTGTTGSSVHPPGYNSSRIDAFGRDFYAVGSVSRDGLGSSFTHPNLQVGLWDSDLGFHFLGDTPGLRTYSTGEDINRNLVVVGRTWSSTADEIAYVLDYPTGNATLLASTGDHHRTRARAVNDQGTIVGSAERTDVGGSMVPFVWTYRDGAVVEAASLTLEGDHTGGELVDVNDDGFAIGRLTYAGRPSRAVCVSLRTSKVIDLGADVTVEAINDAGAIAATKKSGLGFPVAQVLIPGTCQH